MNRVFTALVAIGLMGTAAVIASQAEEIAVYRTPTCGCCTKWEKHLEDNGFSVEDHVRSDLTELKRENGVTPALSSCHTAFIGGYVIEGHVPAADIKRLLEEKPAIAGLAVPKMPIGSPGMEGRNPETYRVLAFDHAGKVETFATHVP